MADKNRLEWQPIETAPKDGTRVLVTLEKCQGFRDKRPMTTAYFNRYYPDDPDEMAEWTLAVPGVGYSCDEKCLPTHWTPLPDPPKEK